MLADTLNLLAAVATDFKGKENKEIREVKNTEMLVDIKGQNQMLLGVVVGAVLLQLIATRFTVSEDEKVSGDETKKDQ